MTNQQKLRKSWRYKILRFIWVYSGIISRKAGMCIVNLSREADKKDWNQYDS